MKNIAIVGATGAVGEAMLELLASRDFPVGELTLLASERSAGTRLPFKEKSLTVKDLAQFDFTGIDIAMFSAGGDVSADYAPKAAAAGCVVIDNTSHFRRDEDIPLIIPEVNLHALDGYKARNIIANPNCSTIQMLVALKPIMDAAGLSRIVLDDQRLFHISLLALWLEVDAHETKVVVNEILQIIQTNSFEC